MSTIIIEFAVSAIEGVAGGVLQNYKLNDSSSRYNNNEETISRLLVDSQRDALTDFYLYGSEDDIYEEFTALEGAHNLVEDREKEKDNENLSPQFKWRESRAPAREWLVTCLKFSFYITVLAGSMVGLVAVLLMFIDINTADVCLTTKWDDVPIQVQRVRVTAQTFEGWLIQFLHIFSMLCVFGWDIISPLHLLSWNLSAGFIDTVYRLYLQVYNVYGIPWISAPLNVLSVSMIVFNSYCIACFFHNGKWQKAVLTFQLGSQFMLGTLTVYFTVYLLIPWFVKLSPLEQAVVAAVAPFQGAICKAISRIATQNIRRVNHPGTSYILLLAAYSAAPIVYRTLQAEIESFKYFAMLCIAHGFVGLLERLSVVLRDHFYVWFYKKVLKRQRVFSRVGMFRTPRTQRLIADLTICNIIQEVSALILTNAFVQLYALQFGTTESGENFKAKDILIEFSLRTLLAITSEFIFTLIGIFVMTWFQNIPLVKVWRKNWKMLLFTNVSFCGILVLYTTQYLLKVVDGKYGHLNATRLCEKSNLIFFSGTEQNKTFD